MPQDGDLRLVRDCLSGTEGAWEAFVARFEPYLSRVCERTLAHRGLPCGPQEVLDALQDLFLVFLEKDLRVLKEYRGEAGATVKTYLAAVAVYRILGRRPRMALAAAGIPSEAASPSPGPLEVLEHREERERVQGEVARLGPQARLALALQADGASLEEVGRSMGISADAAGQLLHRSRDRMRERLRGKS